MATFKAQAAVSDKDKDKSEIMLMLATMGLMVGGITGWFMGGAGLAILGAVVGVLMIAFIARLMLRRVNHVSKDMRLDRD